MIRIIRQHIWIVTLYASHQMVVVSTTNAQYLYNVKNDSISVSDTTKTLPSSVLNKSDTTPVNKTEAKQVATPSYSAEMKDGSLFAVNVKIANTENDYANIMIDIRALNKAMKEKGASWEIPETVPANILCAKVNGQTVKYLVYNDILIGLFKDGLTPNKAPDGSKIFTNSDAIHIASDGSIVATTPTYLLIETPTDRKRLRYADTFAGIPPLTSPRITQGNEIGLADIRDGTLSGRIQVTIATGVMEPKPDE